MESNDWANGGAIKIKSVGLCVFSPTGTGLRVGRNVVEGILGAGELSVREVDLTRVEMRRMGGVKFSREELMVMVMPVYGGRLVPVADEVFAGIEGEGTPAVFCVVYGNRHYDDALAELRVRAETRGFVGVAAGAFVGEHSFTSKVGAGRPDREDGRGQVEFGRRVWEKVAGLGDARGGAGFEVYGNWPSERPVLRLGVAPVTNEKCTDCMACVDGCPTGAIDKRNPRVTDAGKCISCCFCVKVCAWGAKRMEDPRILASVKRLEENFMGRREAEFFL